MMRIEEMEYLENPEFDVLAMDQLVKADGYLAMVRKDLGLKNPTLSEEELLELLFNSFVLDDGGMIEAYLTYL